MLLWRSLIIIIITRRVRPPNGGRLHAPSPVSIAICGRAPAAARWPSHWLKLLPQSMQYVNALSPPIAGERVGVEGWAGNGHLLEAYSTKPTCKPPTYDVQFLRSEALRSSSSSSSSSSGSSSRTRQIKECKIIINNWNRRLSRKRHKIGPYGSIQSVNRKS